MLGLKEKMLGIRCLVNGLWQGSKYGCRLGFRYGLLLLFQPLSPVQLFAIMWTEVIDISPGNLDSSL